MTNAQVQVGPLVIHLYGVIIAAATFFGWLLAKKRAHLYKIPQTLFDDPMLLTPLLLGIIGARLYHVASSWGYYQNNISGIVKIWQGGLGIWGALVGIILGFYIFARIQKINFLNLLDLLAPSLLLAQGIGRIGNFVNQEGFGPPTSLPWGVMIGGTRVHPTFFYEMFLDFIFAIALIYLSPRFKKPGQAIGLYLISYGLIRFLVEFFRIDTWSIGDFKVAFVFSLAAILVGTYLFIRKKKV